MPLKVPKSHVVVSAPVPAPFHLKSVLYPAVGSFVHDPTELHAASPSSTTTDGGGRGEGEIEADRGTKNHS